MKKDCFKALPLSMVVISLFLVSCNPNKNCCCNYGCDICSCKSDRNGIEYLETPVFISFTNNILLWSYVDNASGYVFKINEIEYKAAINYIDISFINLDSGDYSTSVKAISDSVFFIDSCYCEPFTITIL